MNLQKVTESTINMKNKYMFIHIKEKSPVSFSNHFVLHFCCTFCFSLMKRNSILDIDEDAFTNLTALRVL